MLICSLVSGGMGLIDTASIRNSLLNIRFTPENVNSFLLIYSSFTTLFDDLSKTLKMTVDGARWLYGAYSGYALTIFHLPTGIISALGTSVFPVISGALAKNDKRLANKTLLGALEITVIIILPCALVLFMFSEELLYLLFKNTSSAHLLSMLSPALIFLCIADLFILTLHAMGKVFEPFFYSTIGMMIKLLANFILIPVPQFNIAGAIIGSTVSFFVIMLLNMRAVIKYTGIMLYPVNTFLKPFVSACVMFLIMKLVYKPLDIIFASETVALILSCIAGGMGYLLTLMSTNTSTKKEQACKGSA